MDIDIVGCDDWEGLYINGKLFYQHHHVREDEIFEALQLAWSRHEVDYDWFDGYAVCELPENLDDVKLSHTTVIDKNGKVIERKIYDK